MFPKIWIINSYGLLIAIGIILAFIVLRMYCKKINIDAKFYDKFETIAFFAIICGFLSGTLLQSFYNYLDNPQEGFKLFEGITFLGGLLGGVGGFFIIHYFVFKNNKSYGYSELFKILPIVPCCICIAHSFGRIGCFLAGCCYGIQTTSWLGVKFPDLPYKVYPTQLFEAIFLLILFTIMMILLFKTNFKNTVSIYLIVYGMYRFLLEFIRGDDRGSFITIFTPSQFWSLIMVIGGILIIYLSFLKNKQKKTSV